MKHFVAAPSVGAWVRTWTPAVAAGRGELYDHGRCATDIGNAESGGQAEGGVGLHSDIIVLKVGADCCHKVVVEVPLTQEGIEHR